MRDADSIAVVFRGKIIEQGAHEEVRWATAAEFVAAANRSDVLAHVHCCCAATNAHLSGNCCSALHCSRPLPHRCLSCPAAADGHPPRLLRPPGAPPADPHHHILAVNPRSQLPAAGHQPARTAIAVGRRRRRQGCAAVSSGRKWHCLHLVCD